MTKSVMSPAPFLVASWMATPSVIVPNRLRNRPSLSRSARSIALRSVISTPALSTPVGLPASSRNTVLRHSISFSSPSLVSTGFSKNSAGSISPVINCSKTPLTRSRFFGGMKCSNQSFPTKSSSVQLIISVAFLFASVMRPPLSSATNITGVRLRCICARSFSAFSASSACFCAVISTTICSVAGFPS